MPTPKSRSHPKKKQFRIPSDEEVQRILVLQRFAHAQARLKKQGLIELVLPRGLRVRKPAPQTEQETNDKILARLDELLEERVKARVKAAGIPYTDKRPYGWLSKRDRRAAEERARAEAEQEEAAHDREVALNAFDPGI